MKTQEYFDKKVEGLRNELYSEINELVAIYKETGKRCFINPQNDEEIAFFNDSSHKLENRKIADILIDKKGVCIYPKSNDFLPYELSDVIDIHDLMILRSIIAVDSIRNGLYVEINELASICRGDAERHFMYPHNDEMMIQFLNTSSDKAENLKIKNITIVEEGVYIYPESNDCYPCDISRVTNIQDLKILKLFMEQEIKNR